MPIVLESPDVDVLYFSLIFYFGIVQVCLMSQSWDNVVSMHDHLSTVHAHKT